MLATVLNVHTLGLHGVHFGRVFRLVVLLQDRLGELLVEARLLRELLRREGLIFAELTFIEQTLEVSLLESVVNLASILLDSELPWADIDHFLVVCELDEVELLLVLLDLLSFRLLLKRCLG